MVKLRLPKDKEFFQVATNVLMYNYCVYIMDQNIIEVVNSVL